MCAAGCQTVSVLDAVIKAQNVSSEQPSGDYEDHTSKCEPRDHDNASFLKKHIYNLTENI